MEIGYAAVGVGFLVGFAMTRATVQRTQQLAYAAAGWAYFAIGTAYRMLAPAKDEPAVEMQQA